MAIIIGIIIFLAICVLCSKLQKKPEPVIREKKDFFTVTGVEPSSIEPYFVRKTPIENDLVECYDSGDKVHENNYKFKNVTVSGNEVSVDGSCIGTINDNAVSFINSLKNYRLELTAYYGRYAEVVGNKVEYGNTDTPEVYLNVIHEVEL